MVCRRNLITELSEFCFLQLSTSHKVRMSSRFSRELGWTYLFLFTETLHLEGVVRKIEMGAGVSKKTCSCLVAVLSF